MPPIRPIHSHDPLTMDDAREILEILGGDNDLSHRIKRKWNEVSLESLRRYTYSTSDYQEAIWDEVSVACPEPWRYHIDMWGYITEEYFKTGLVVGVAKVDGEWVKMGKWEMRAVESDFEFEEAWIIKLDELEEDMPSLLEYEEAAIEAWREQQEDIRRGK